MVKRILLWCCVLLVLVGLPAQSASLPTAKNFLLDAQQVIKNKTPILVLFSEHNCPYCEVVKEEALIPILQLAEYQKKIIIREVSDENDNFYNFYNELSTAYQFNQQYQIDFFPTVVILDENGHLISPKLIGIVDQEFYWQKIDEIINIALINLNK